MRINNMISTRNFANPSHAKFGAGTIIQEPTPNVGNLSIKWVALKLNLILIKWICGLIHKFCRSINLLTTKFCLSSNCFIGFWYTYICFDSKYRAVVVASIQILLAQRILDMAYFLHYYYYGHLLSIIILYNLWETSRYAGPASVIINNNTGLKVGLVEAEHHHATIRPSSPTTPILRLLLEYWMFGNWQTG